MAEIVAHIPESLPDITHEALGGPSINVGTILGGEKVNIVPATCVIEIDRRSLPGETEESLKQGIEAAVDRARDKYPDIEADVELQFFARPFEIPEGAAVVQAMLGAVGHVRAGTPELMGFRGASDARFFAEAGADVIVCGPGDITLAHTATEHVEIAEVNEAAFSYAIAFATLVGR
jgi:acetylornithine deacetylase/succinyl-diaminopimelate desuccinylase-like protein